MNRVSGRSGTLEFRKSKPCGHTHRQFHLHTPPKMTIHLLKNSAELWLITNFEGQKSKIRTYVIFSGLCLLVFYPFTSTQSGLKIKNEVTSILCPFIISPLIISTFPVLSTPFLSWRKCAYLGKRRISEK